MLRVLRPKLAVHLFDDDLAARDLGGVRDEALELLLAQPLGYDAGRLVGMGRGVEEVDGAHDAVTGLDEEVAAEARKLAEARGQTRIDLLLQLVGALGVDSFVASHDGMHVLLLTVDLRTENSDER